ncbi:septal ring lytic transglycosylase RlpA family protein [Portibacter marinus]|uniref:septal ring lytic transglycosylase RlpA family protein n=1 Tax=Portibacter marinus TaxID=2898660 RepID=UPI001F41C427|nr:septal ring lytic transglycosylase RlpA family protein [Portibacter marinus]
MQSSSFFILVVLLLIFNCSPSYNYEEIGEASFYANLFIGRKTASGEVFYQDSLTAAHPVLPFGTKVKVTNLENGKSIMVKINDRGPFAKDRIIDLTRRAADSLEFLKSGTTEVVLQANVSDDFLQSLAKDE